VSEDKAARGIATSGRSVVWADMPESLDHFNAQKRFGGPH